MSHKKRLYICCCSDKSSTSPIKIYVKLREIISEGKKLRGEGKRPGTLIMSCISLLVPWYTYVVWSSLALSSSNPELYYIALIRSLDDAYVGNTTGSNPFPLYLFSSTCSFKGSRNDHRSTYRTLLQISFSMTQRGGGQEEEIFSESSDDTKGFGV